MAPVERQLGEMVRVLMSGWGARGARRALLNAAIRHAIDFRTWESLVQHGGITAAQGARLMRALVEGALRPPYRGRTGATLRPYHPQGRPTRGRFT